MLRILHKHYGGIDIFKNQDLSLFVECLENAVKKENEIPKLILEYFNALTGKFEIPNFPIKKQMRNVEEILKDYGMKEDD